MEFSLTWLHLICFRCDYSVSTLLFNANLEKGNKPNKEHSFDSIQKTACLNSTDQQEKSIQ